MSLVVKICGLSTQSSVEAAVDAGADMVGFVFFERSPRHVSLGKACELGKSARGRAAIVALTVDADESTVCDIIDALRPDLLQLHGGEPPERIEYLRAKFKVPLMKAVGIAGRADLEAARKYVNADRILIDAKAPADAAHPGGNGFAFDWRLLEDFVTPAPFMLSGGLDASNVGEAIRVARPGGVDVSSGVERAPGLKDEAMIAAFVRAARAAAA
ncbi:MAG: phosphoribosylanthranilate isomerase [Hyphomicrobiales bacterium]|nr:phosphoribosylanthranilate isomerase [Hyphomicrobiales bacterium]